MANVKADSLEFVEMIEKVLNGNVLRPTCLRGRFETTVDNAGMSWLVDVCHNVDGAKAFVESVRAIHGDSPLPGCVSILRDKDVNGILDILRPVICPLVVFAHDGERHLTRDVLDARHRDLTWVDNFAAAADQMTRFQQTPKVLCGSVAVVGEVLYFWEGSACHSPC